MNQVQKHDEVDAVRETSHDSLLIVGNGFDLACGLRSSYGDFFEWLKKDAEGNDTDFAKALSEISHHYSPETILRGNYSFSARKKLKNIWLVYFISKHIDSGMTAQTKKWSDIEKDVYDLLKNFEIYIDCAKYFNKSPRRLKEEALFFQEYADLDLTYVVTSTFLYFLSVSDLKIHFDIYKDTDDFSYKNICKHHKELYEQALDNPALLEKYNDFLSTNADLVIKLKVEHSKTFFPILLNSLREIELKFSEYLNSEVASYKDYISNATRLFNGLRNDTHAKVLCFNYTNPLGLSPREIKHVHGLIKAHGGDDNLIFGIDERGEGNNPTLEYTQFTKTYRTIKSQDDTIKDFFELPNKDSVKSIKFFGHSFSDADFSYFHSLFDYYDIYSSRVILQFYYSKGYDSKIPEIHALIKKYGEQLDKNSEKGANLLHKLILESRLRIIEIDPEQIEVVKRASLPSPDAPK